MPGMSLMRAEPVEARSVPALARVPVFAVAAAVGVALLATSWRFGYFGDELYFVAAGRHHLDWGYADQPWLLPLLARAVDAVAPGSVVVLRVLPMLLTVLGVVLTALTARELGGGRRAQLLAAGAYAISFQILGSGHILATSTVDPFCWTLLTWLVVRWVRLRRDRLLLLAGIVTAVALQAKFLIAFFWAAVALAALCVGPRRLLTRPALWAGGVISVAVTVPTLLWQAEHGWPYLRMQEVVAEQVNRFMGGRIAIVPLAVLFAGVLVGAFLACHGVWRLLRSRELSEYRFLGWAILAVLAVFVLTLGRYYYAAGLYGLAFAASAVGIERHGTARWWRWVPTWPVYAVSAILAVVITLPIRPASMVTSTNFTESGSLGWPRVAATTEEVYRDLPLAQRRDTVVMTHTYWQAGALEVHGAARSLPDVHSAERGYWYFGPPGPAAETVLYVGADGEYLRRFFGDVDRAATVRLDAPERNVNQNLPVWVCQNPTAPWPSMWQRMHRW